MEQARINLIAAYQRIFIDSVADRPNYASKVFQKLQKMVYYIAMGFRSVLNQVKWLSPTSRAKALLKLDNMPMNLLWLNESIDDEALKNYYNSLNFNENNTMAEIRDKVTAFQQLRQFVDKFTNSTPPRNQMTADIKAVSSNFKSHDGAEHNGMCTNRLSSDLDSPELI